MTNLPESDMPTCDKCGRGVVWSEIWGWRHVTFDHPYGVPVGLDDTGHEATCTDGWKLN